MENQNERNLCLEALSLFVGSTTSDRLIVRQPFELGSIAFATDMNSLAIVPVELVEPLAEFREPDRSSNNSMGKLIIDYWQAEATQKETIPIALIREALEGVPQVEGYESQTGRITCDACDGYGEVVYEFYHEKNYEIEESCPVCEGAGKKESEIKVPNGKMMPDPDAQIEISGEILFVKQIDRVLRAAQTLQEDSITAIGKIGNRNGLVFRVGQMKVVVMGVAQHSWSNDRIVVPAVV